MPGNARVFTPAREGGSRAGLFRRLMAYRDTPTAFFHAVGGSMKIIQKPTEQLIPYAANAKLHDETQIANVANSIKNAPEGGRLANVGKPVGVMPVQSTVGFGVWRVAVAFQQVLPGLFQQGDHELAVHGDRNPRPNLHGFDFVHTEVGHAVLLGDIEQGGKGITVNVEGDGRRHGNNPFAFCCKQYSIKNDAKSS